MTVRQALSFILASSLPALAPAESFQPMRPGDALWVDLFGYPSERPVITAVASDPFDEAVVAMYFHDGIVLGNQSHTSPDPVFDSDAALASFNSAGDLVWSHVYATPDSDALPVLATDFAGDIVIGAQGGGDDGLDVGCGAPGTHWSLAVLDSSGTCSFALPIRTTPAPDGSSGLTMAKLATTPDGGMLLTGRFFDAVDFGAGPKTRAGWHAYIASLDAGGTVRWIRVFGAMGTTPVSVAVDPNGFFSVAGTFSGTIDDLGRSPLVAPADGQSAFVARMRVFDGSTVWAQSYGDGWALASDVGMTGIGRPVLLGMFRDHIDLGGVVLTNSDAALDTFVLELANDGSFRYAWQLGGTASMQPTAMAVDSIGDIVVSLTAVAGHLVTGTWDFALPGNSPSLFVLQIEPTFQKLNWIRRDGIDFQFSEGKIAISPDNRVTLAGTFIDSDNFGTPHDIVSPYPAGTGFAAQLTP